MNDCVYLSDEYEAVCVCMACPARSNICPCLDYQHYEPHVKTSIYDECETHDNCTVEIWKNSTTGETSIGWYENERS